MSSSFFPFRCRPHARSDRFVDVNKLIRAKYQDNLEFCQWLKAFYDQSGVFRDDYDPMAVRAKGKGGKAYNAKLSTKKGRSKVKPRPAGHLGIPKTNNAPPPPSVPESKSVSTTGTRPSRPIRQRPSEDSVDLALKGETSNGAVDDALVRENELLTEEKNALAEENEALKNKTAELEATVGTLEEAVLETEQERQFYFDKLRNVEVLLQVHQENTISQDGETTALMDKIFKILYAVSACCSW